MSLITFFSGITVFDMQTQLAIKKSTLLIEALDAYKTDTGHYPKELEIMQGKYIEEIPIINFGVFSTEEFGYGSFDGEFRLIVPTYSIDMTGAYLYDTPNRTWYFDD